jgi:hypothetical protein
MRLTIVVAIAGICGCQVPAVGADRPFSAFLPEPIATEITGMLPPGIDYGSDQIVFASAGAVFAAISLNYMSGGAIAALFGIGGSTASAATLITFALTEMAWFATDVGLGPAVLYSVGQPVDAALRDGYTTPSTLAAAFAESGRRASEIAVGAGTYVGTTVGAWWSSL